MNVADLFRRHAVARPCAEAFRCGGAAHTWCDVDRRSDALAAHLAESLAVGERVAIVALNCHRYWETHAACAKAGLVSVPINHRLLPDEVATIVAEVDARGIVTDDRVALVRRDGTDILDGFAEVGGVAVSSGPARAGVLSYEEVAARAVATPPDRRHPVNAIGFTSGTTGKAKGAILSHHTATTSALWFATLFGLTPESTFLACMPAYVYRGQAGGLSPVVVGARTIPLAFEAGEVLRVIEAERVTHVILAPAMVDLLLNHPDLPERDLTSLRSTWIGGAPTSPDAVRRLAEHVGGTLGAVYGMTEATGIASMRWNLDGPPDELARELSSVGRPAPILDVRLLDPDGAEVAVGEPGEVTVRGDSLMDGYWGEPAGAAFDDGWYRTGDIATRDEEGRLYLVDRRADVIVSGGLNVYAAEVERVVAGHQAVVACAVVSAPDERWGETVAAVVVLAPGATLTLDDLQRHCAAALAGYKSPRRIEAVDALPANAMGKVDKKALRDRFWEDHTRPIG